MHYTLNFHNYPVILTHSQVKYILHEPVFVMITFPARNHNGYKKPTPMGALLLGAASQI